MQKFIFIYGFLLKLFDIFKFHHFCKFLCRKSYLYAITLCVMRLSLNFRLSADCTGQ